MRLCGILFDKDGTLVSFEKTWGPTIGAMIFALAGGDAKKIAAQAEVLHFLVNEQTFLPTSPIIAGSTGQFGLAWAQALERTDYERLKQEIDALAAVESLRALSPIGAPVEVIEALRKRGLRIGVATNDSEASARRQVAALGLADLVDFIAGYDSGHGSKPDPGMVHAFADFLGVEPSRIAMVGDSTHDLDAARAAGALAIAVLSGPASREVLAPHADYVIDDITFLGELVAGLI